MADNISLDQVRVNNRYNLKSLYELDATNIDDDYESPFSYIDCNYYEPEQFNEKTKEFQNSTSYFHLNCHSLNITYCCPMLKMWNAQMSTVGIVIQPSFFIYF